MSLELKTRHHINNSTQHVTEVEKKLYDMDSTDMLHTKRTVKNDKGHGSVPIYCKIDGSLGINHY